MSLLSFQDISNLREGDALYPSDYSYLISREKEYTRAREIVRHESTIRFVRQDEDKAYIHVNLGNFEGCFWRILLSLHPTQEDYPHFINNENSTTGMYVYFREHAEEYFRDFTVEATVTKAPQPYMLTKISIFDLWCYVTSRENCAFAYLPCVLLEAEHQVASSTTAITKHRM